jgi:steroid 5-alpha reductase family enzyme
LLPAAQVKRLIAVFLNFFRVVLRNSHIKRGKTSHMKTSHGILILFIVVIVGAFFAWAGGQLGAQWVISNDLTIPIFTLGVGLMFIIQWLAFIPAFILRTEHFYDLVGSASYVIFVILVVLANPSTDLRSLLLASLVLIWALRLGTFLVLRVRRVGKDRRFDELKQSALRFLIAWTVQGLWIVLTAGCALVVIASPQHVAMTWLDLVGLSLWLLGFSIEAIADWQKRQFKINSNGKDSFITTGLWAHSRHPNYFGEITLWLGVSLLAYPALQEWQYVTLISPFFVLLLLTKISGIPLLEEAANKRWGDDPAYQAYKQRTPVLVPKLSSH